MLDTSKMTPIYSSQWTGNGQQGDFNQGQQVGWGAPDGNGGIVNYDMDGNVTYQGSKGDWGQFLKGAGLIVGGGLGLSALGVGMGGGAAGGLLEGGGSAFMNPDVLAPVTGAAPGMEYGALAGAGIPEGAYAASNALLGAPMASTAGGLGAAGAAAGGAGALGSAGGLGGLLGSNAGLIGAALGAVAGSQDATKSDTTKKEPWAEAAPWMKANLKTGQNLQNFYEQNPFNPQQKTSYQNLFSGVDNFNQSMPGLMDFANKAMTSNYQRQRGGAPGSGGGYGGGVVPGGLLQSGQGAFSVPQSQNYGLLNWSQLNPFANGVNGTPRVGG